MQPFSVSQAVRSILLDLLALLIIVSGALNTPGTVLCVGPGNHYHLEVVVGAGCVDGLPASQGVMPRPRDGCPSGSKDFRLTVDTCRSDNTRVISAPAAALLLPSGLMEFSNLSHPPESFCALPTSSSPAFHSTIVLRC
jgi:hypothetical protein